MMNHVIYINGEKRHCTDPSGGSFYADLSEYKNAYCSQHCIGQAAVRAMRNGATVRTGGNTYSFNPPRPAAPAPAPTPVMPISRRTALRRWARRKLIRLADWIGGVS